MGRAPGGAKESKQKHAPLQSQLKEDLSGTLRDGHTKKSKKHKTAEQPQDDTDVVPAGLSEKILRLAREQQEEDQEPSASTG